MYKCKICLPTDEIDFPNFDTLSNNGYEIARTVLGTKHKSQG